MRSRNRRGLLSYLFLLVLVVASCRPGDDAIKKENERYAAFINKINYEFYKGNCNNLPERLDSFYALQQDVQPYNLYQKYESIGNFYFDQGKQKLALDYADSGLNVLKQYGLENKYSHDYVGSLNFKGKVLYAHGDYAEAFDYYFRGKQVAEQLKDTCTLAQYTYNLGMACYNQKKYADAAGYFKQTFAYTKVCKGDFPNAMQEFIDNIALCYEKLQMWDSAVFYYDSTLSYLEVHKAGLAGTQFKEKAEGVVYGNLGTVLLRMGHTDSAIAYLKKSYEIDLPWNYDPGDALLTHLKLAEAYLGKNDLGLTAQALQMLQKELDTIRHNIDADCKMQQLTYQYYEKKGDETEAYKHYKSYSSLKDSIWQNDRKQLQADAGSELNKKQQQYEILQLQKNNQMNHLYLWVIVFCLVTAMLIGTLVYVNYYKSKKNVAVLKALNNQISLQKTELEKKNKEKDRILNIVAHDLRSPVSGIAMMADMMLEDNRFIPQQDFYTMVKNSSLNSLALINELLGVRTDDLQDMKKERMDILPVVKECADFYKYKAIEKHIAINLSLPEGAVMVAVNKEKISRVLGNLLANAIKFCKVGGTIKVMVAEGKGKVVIGVQDNGIGIPEKMLAQLFDMFTAAKRNGTAGEKSFGLGLSISKQIVEAHGGRIWVESEEGKGSTFFVDLLNG